MAGKRTRVGILETFGIHDPKKAVKEAMTAIRGRNDIPATKYDLSSARLLKPHISIPTWIGITRKDRKIPRKPNRNGTESRRYR